MTHRKKRNCSGIVLLSFYRKLNLTDVVASFDIQCIRFHNEIVFKIRARKQFRRHIGLTMGSVFPDMASPIAAKTEYQNETTKSDQETQK
eukprot:3667279-Amphidinium_carterae.1